MNPYNINSQCVLHITTDESKNRYHFGDVGQTSLFKMDTPDSNGNTYVLTGDPALNCSGTWMKKDRAMIHVELRMQRELSRLLFNEDLFNELFSIKEYL